MGLRAINNPKASFEDPFLGIRAQGNPAVSYNSVWDSSGSGVNEIPPLSPISATGGSDATAGGYKIHTFNTSGNFTVSSGNNYIEFLVVGGGGGGGQFRGAGG